MQKQISLKLYKNLLLSDFGLIQGLNSNLILATCSVQSTFVKFFYLDLFECIKTLKVLIRGLHFIQNQPKNRLVIRISNFQYYLLLKDFIKEEALSYNLILMHDKKFINILNLDFTQFYFFFGSNNLSLNGYRQLLLQKIFLIMRINLQAEFSACGYYKVNSDVLDIKKVMFLILLINKICSIKNINESI